MSKRRRLVVETLLRRCCLDHVVTCASHHHAVKYAGRKDAVDKLAAKIIKGGSGVWGPVPMPANAQVNEAEAKKLAAWVLTQK